MLRLWRRSPRASARGSASQLLRQSGEVLGVRERLELLRRLVPKKPSIHDERLKRLATEVLAQRHELPLSALVEAAKAFEELGLQEELGPLVAMATESAGFLPGEVVLSFARTLAVTRHSVDELAVFKLLGEHILERMFDAAPLELSEALLAIAVFCCSRHRRLVEPALEAPWHHEVFAAGRWLLQAPGLEGKVLLKCLRAYTLYFSEAKGAQGALLEDACRLLGERQQESNVFQGLLERLQSCLHEFTGHSLVRALHCGYCLEEQSLLPVGVWASFRAAVGQRLQGLEAELSCKDLGYAMQAIALWDKDLAAQLLKQVLHHVLAMTPKDALRILRAAKLVPPGLRSEDAMEVLKAEVVRGLRDYSAPEFCSALRCFVEIRAKDPELLQRLGEAFGFAKLPPRQLSTALASLARLQLRDGPVVKEVVPSIVRDIVGYTHRDLSLCLWAMAKASQKDLRLCARAQQLYMEGQNSRGLNHLDISMILWSFSRLQWRMNPELLSRLTQQLVLECPTATESSLLMTTLALARMGFTHPLVLAPVFRSLYGRLSGLKDDQLALSFVLFSGSGVRDYEILSRMLFETRKRLDKLQGRDFTNVVMACFRSSTPSLMQDVGLYDSLKLAIFERFPGLAAKLKLRIFLAAPSLFDLTKEETSSMADGLLPHLSQMDPPSLTRCIVGCARRQLVHEAFLQAVFQALREAREAMSPVDVISCIYSVYVLSFWTPKFRRSLGYILMQHVKAWRIPAARLRDVLPALQALGFWQRLPGPLTRAVWRIAPEDLRRGVAPPPKPDRRPEDTEARQGWAKFRLQRLKRGSLRRIVRKAREDQTLSQKHGLKTLEKNPWQGRERRRQEEELVESRRQEAKESPPTAVESFIKMVRRL